MTPVKIRIGESSRVERLKGIVNPYLLFFDAHIYKGLHFFFRTPDPVYFVGLREFRLFLYPFFHDIRHGNLLIVEF
jgi:hypothetical protein